MMKQKILIVISTIWTISGFTQEVPPTTNQRLDFAKSYFEIGGTFLPSFSGKMLQNNEVINFENPASAIQYLNWGAFHFWGHAEFYVTIPLSYNPFKENEERSSELLHSVATGARFYPWPYREKAIRPYAGVSWSALDFRQIIKPNEDQPVLSKDFMLAYDAGLVYGYKNFSVRLGMNYFPDTKWSYPISRTAKAEINTPNLGLQIGLLYLMDFSKETRQENIDKWNNYPPLSKQSLGSSKFGNFFVGVGPSLSFSLKKSEYNQSKFPYLKEKLTSTNYFDIVGGYHFQKLGLFSALSFRNPKFVTEGYGTTQTLKKSSLTFEVNKFLMDYSGFTPYVGLNIAYDRLKYEENIDGEIREMKFDDKMELGFTFGWDIQPGKNDEALILRTNLRWYPFSSYEIEGKAFNFSQLEYNLIQVVFYPGRLKKKK